MTVNPSGHSASLVAQFVKNSGNKSNLTSKPQNQTAAQKNVTPDIDQKSSSKTLTGSAVAPTQNSSSNVAQAEKGTLSVNKFA